MELLYVVIAAAIIILPFALSRLLPGAARDTGKVLGAQPRRAPAPVARRDTAAVSADPVRQEVGRLLAHGRKLDAIKLMRERTGLPLAEAKEAVETMDQRPGAVERPASLVATLRHAQEVSDAVQKLVAQGKRVDAVKLLREQSGIGLKEAKDLVDRLG